MFLNGTGMYRFAPCARVRPCVPCVSRLPPVSFYRLAGMAIERERERGSLPPGARRAYRARSVHRQEMAKPPEPPPPLFAALCLPGILRGGSGDAKAVAHWTQQAGFARKLMLGAPSWDGLHVILANDAAKADMKWTARSIREIWHLPQSNVHEVYHPINVSQAVARRCGDTSGLPRDAPLNDTQPWIWARKVCYWGNQSRGDVKCPGALDANYRSFYVQWVKAAACFARVKEIEEFESQWRSKSPLAAFTSPKFEFVVKARDDWPFTDAPPLVSMRVGQRSTFHTQSTETLVYARVRCAPVSHRVPVSFHSMNTHNPWAINGGCPLGTYFMDDQFVVAPRARADALFRAETLSCPNVNQSIRDAVKFWCGGYAIQECFLYVHLQLEPVQWIHSYRVDSRLTVFAPIPVMWDNFDNLSRDPPSPPPRYKSRRRSPALGASKA